MQAVKQQNSPYSRYLVRREILYAKDKNAPYSRPLLPTELEDHVMHYVHTLLGHLETEKCMFHISYAFHLKNLSRKVRKPNITLQCMPDGWASHSQVWDGMQEAHT